MEARPVTVVQSAMFETWLSGLRDRSAAAVIVRRIDRLGRGNKGDVKAVGGGVFELRINQGPGYRIYFAERDGAIVILLCGGDKSSQAGDIKRAKALASEV